MWKAIAFAVVMAGCATDVAPVADENLEGCYHSGTFCVPYGAACDSSSTPFCAGGPGWCSQGVCEHQCNPVRYPPCPAGETARNEDAHDGTATPACVCIAD